MPLADVPVVFSLPQENGQQTLLAIRTTDSSGLTAPVYLDTPDRSDSLTPGTALKPYATIEISAGLPGYNRITARGVQIFPGVETVQDLQLHPVSPADQNEIVTFPGNEQNL